MTVNQLPIEYLKSLKKDKYRREKLNFIYLFLMGMTQIRSTLTLFKEQIRDGKMFYCNFYSGLLMNNFEHTEAVISLFGEYQKHFMYRIIDQLKIITSYYFHQLSIASADTGGGKST